MEITKQRALLKKLINGGLISIKDLGHVMKIILAVERIEQERVKKQNKNKQNRGGVLYVDGGISGPGNLVVSRPMKSIEEWMEKASKVKLPESALRKDEIGCEPEFVVEKEPPKPQPKPEPKELPQFIRA